MSIKKYQRVQSGIGFAAIGESKPIAPPRATRQWLFIEIVLGLAGAVVQWGKGSSSTTWGYAYLEPGERIVFSETGDMPWRGSVYISGDGGTAGYRSNEVYEEEG